MATDPTPADRGPGQAPDQSEADSPEQRQSGDYEHQDPAVQRPAVGVQEDFPDRRPPKEYRYDSSLAPELCWDENGERAFGDWLLDLIERGATDGEAAVFGQAPTWSGTSERFHSMAECAAPLKSLTRPFLNWSGKAERQRIRVPTIPLFVHERQSTQAILSTLEGYKAIGTTGDLFGDPRLDAPAGQSVAQPGHCARTLRRGPRAVARRGGGATRGRSRVGAGPGRNPECRKPRRGATYQSRATPWGRRPNRSSPEGA